MTKKITKLMLNGQEYEIREYQGGGGGGRQPGANTLFYMPLNSTYTDTDQSGNNISTTNSNTTFGTYTSANVDCGYFDGISSHIQVTPFNLDDEGTILAWIYSTGPNDSDGKIFDARGSGGNPCIINADEVSPQSKYCHISEYSGDSAKCFGSYNNAWILYSVTYSNGSQIVRLLGDNLDVNATSSNNMISFTPQYINVGNEWNNGAGRHYSGYMSELIVEDRERTQQEISDYYDQTKSLYGIS